MDRKRQVSSDLVVELVIAGRPTLWISREDGGRVRVKLSEIPHLAEVLGNVAADLVGYRVGENMFDDYADMDDDWRQLIGQCVQMRDGRVGRVMGPVGDWSNPVERGCLLLSFADGPPQVHHLKDLEPVDR